MINGRKDDQERIRPQSRPIRKQDFESQNRGFSSFILTRPRCMQCNYLEKFFSDVDECSTPANNCKYTCKNLIGSFMCTCPEGYRQISMTDECEDIDECKNNRTICLDGLCINLEGSYRCDCFTGFEASPDGKECKGTSIPPSLALI